MSETVAAVVVTYNRKDLLIECLEALRNQTHKPDAIFIIDNKSNDGTPKLLLEKNYISILPNNDSNENQIIKNQISSLSNPTENIEIYYIRKFENDGGAGGFYEGMKRAYEKGYDWTWTMDDDIELEKDCLEKLLLIAKHEIENGFLVYLPDRKVIGSNSIWRYGTNFNFKNPFKNESTKSISVNDFSEDFTQIKSITFEGPLFHKTVVEKIGNVNKELFIAYDDTEYSIRMDISNIKVALVKDALLYRKNQNTSKVISLKDYYLIRNSIFLDTKFGNKLFMNLRLATNLIRYSKALIRTIVKGNTRNIRYIFQGVLDGYKNKLGKFSK